jgi:FixJ family two-component response regulator/glycine cleavage system H lipoate-binding protein
MLIIIVTLIVFLALDFLIRYLLKKRQQNKIRQNREQALENSYQIDLSYESKTLKRAEVPNAKARILCIDDEEVVLDSFRKILVLDGFSVDTVESGKEGLVLIHKHNYDFTYVDLKMPDMGGVEVTKAIKESRPDIDVVIVTGYGSVESAVETMKYGAMDYVQKPFTPEELIEFANRNLSNRQERIRDELKPTVHVSSLAEFKSRGLDEFFIPGGVFISDEHCWLSLNTDGTVKIGIDDFINKLIGPIEKIEFPNVGREIKRSQTLFSVSKGKENFYFGSPVSGKVLKVQEDLNKKLDELDHSPYDKNWVCIIDADNLDTELVDLKIGKSAVAFFQDEIVKKGEKTKKTNPR